MCVLRDSNICVCHFDSKICSDFVCVCVYVYVCVCVCVCVSGTLSWSSSLLASGGRLAVCI